MCRRKILSCVVAVCCATGITIQAQVACVTCPAGANATGVAPTLTAKNVATGLFVFPGVPVGSCQQLQVLGALGYTSSGAGGSTPAGYYGGQAVIKAYPGNAVLAVAEAQMDVTPAALASTKIGPSGNACADTDKLDMNPWDYTLSAADIAAGAVTFQIVYSGGTSLINTAPAGQPAACTLPAGGDIAYTVAIAPAPTCTIPPLAAVCEGANVTLGPVAPTGTGPFTYCWRKACPSGGVGACLGTSDSLQLNPVQVTDAGCYEVTVSDTFGCTTTCTVTLAVNPNPTCTIAGPSPVCAGSAGNTYSSTVSPSGGTVTHSWTITGNGTIIGSTTGASVSVTAGAAGTFTLTDNITREGCPGQCTLTVTVNPNPTCTIAGPSPVCERSADNTYTTTVSPPGGTVVTHSWTISGNGTIVGPTDQASVSVTAGAAGTFTVTDNIMRDGCPGQCAKTVTVNPNPTCTIAGPSPVCENSTGNTYTTTVLPAGGTVVTHSWTISGNGTIVGPTDQATVTVTAGPIGSGTSFTVTDNIMRDGCPGQCAKTVTINPCAPKLCVTKAVACAPASGICDGTLTYGPTASGIVGTTDPNFCYKITVRNCGDEDLNNVTISDPDLPGLTISSTLTVGQTVTIFASKTWGVGTHVNTVTVSGVGATSGVSACLASDSVCTASATVVVVPISVDCTVTLLASDDQDNNPNDNHLTLPPTDAGTSITGGPTTGFHLVVNNTGQSDVTVNVTDAFTGDVSLANCVVVDDTGTQIVPQPADFTALPLAVGAHVNIVCDIVLGQNACPGPDTITVTVVGTAVATTTIPCIYDSSGNKITTAASTCNGTIICQQPTTCRTTGGGDLYAGDQNMDCVTTTTVLRPGDLNGLVLDHVSHGGQLGAPYSHEDCQNLLANPCIRGQWQHNRHYIGQGNPRLVFDADFHSNTPKGVFDTLECACLGCCPGETDKKGPQGQFAGLGQHFELCNPNDHIACGPMPRPAPANALIWSGMGTMKFQLDNTSPKSSEWVVMRVYIEDRSEPGGFHPKGSVSPADIYSFQVWRTGFTVSNKRGAAGYDPNALPTTGPLGDILAFRAALSADSCNFIQSISVDGNCKPGSLPSDTIGTVGVDAKTAYVNDSGALRNGNRQIHPSTDAPCTATGGIAPPAPLPLPNPYCIP